jgi:exosome complex exonuclease DIS3/RRP44
MLIGQAQKFVLSDRPTGTKNFPTGHYLLPDTNAFLYAIDLFEAEKAFRDVIVLQTVLEEVRNRSLPLYHRLVGLTNAEDKRFYVFFNEFRQETYVVRNQGETVNDRNDRAIRRAAAWYRDHLKSTVRNKSSVPSIVLITDDKDNLAKAKKDGILASSGKKSRLL